MNSWWRWRCMLRPITIPSRTHRGEQGGRSVSLVVMGHRSGAALLHRQPGLGAVEGLDLALFIDEQITACAGGST